MDGFSWCSECQSLLDEEDLFCSNCGKSVEQKPEPAAGEASDLSEVLTHHFECSGCGASMSYDASASSLRCPYCGSKRLEQRADVKSVKPTQVIPFRETEEAVHRRIIEWLGSGFWRPSDLAASAIFSKVAPVYVPYWVFSADVHTYWTADSAATPLGARGDWYPISGENKSRYDGLLVGASGVLTPAETNAICPFDLSGARPTDDVDLENSIVEQFTVPRKYARPLARAGLEQSERKTCAERYINSRYRNLKVNVLTTRRRSQPVLLPVWVVAYEYRDKLYRILVNGQTGKVSGHAPFSYFKAALVASLAVLIGLLFVIIILLASS